jgi:hypothetical protein
MIYLHDGDEINFNTDPGIKCVIQIEGPQAEQACDLQAHMADLNFAMDCLMKIESSDDLTIRRALWRIAIIYYSKCFGDSNGRKKKLSAKKILGTLSEKEFTAAHFNHTSFINLRNKNLIHDDSPFSYSLLGAALYHENTSRRIFDFIHLDHETPDEQLMEEGVFHLKILIRHVQDWVKISQEKLESIIRDTLEAKPYIELLNFPRMTVKHVAFENLTKPKREFLKK